jgi:glycosyltransferase involved in cell wall biosynthesis
MIKKLGLEKNIIFTGILSEEQMVGRFLKSNLFVCPSSIENSPNSVGEAQLLGVPCIGSFVGGMSDMITDEESGLIYRFEETEMLAEKVCRIFSDPSFAKKLSENGRIVAQLRHHKQVNATRLREIYSTILKQD